MPSSEELQFAFSGDSKFISDKAMKDLDELNSRIANLENNTKWDELAHYLHTINEDKGFWGDPVFMDKIVAKLMLVVTEVAEVVEALRKSQGKDKVTEEFADVFIRLLDVYAVLVDIGEADPLLYKVLHDKTDVNRSRPLKHGNRWG